MYRIQQRTYSSNIIEKGEIESDKVKWEPYIAPLVKKQEGDKLCEELIKHLQS